MYGRQADHNDHAAGLLPARERDSSDVCPFVDLVVAVQVGAVRPGCRRRRRCCAERLALDYKVLAGVAASGDVLSLVKALGKLGVQTARSTNDGSSGGGDLSGVGTKDH